MFYTFQNLLCIATRQTYHRLWRGHNLQDIVQLLPTHHSGLFAWRSFWSMVCRTYGRSLNCRCPWYQQENNRSCIQWFSPLKIIFKTPFNSITHPLFYHEYFSHPICIYRLIYKSIPMKVRGVLLCYQYKL